MVDVRKAVYSPILGAVLVAALGCHDSPTGIVGTPSPATAPAANALAASRDLLHDPLVTALIADADHARVTRTMQQLRDVVTAGDAETIRRAVHQAKEDLTQTFDIASTAARAALGLTLAAVVDLLDDTTNTEFGTSEFLNP